MTHSQPSADPRRSAHLSIDEWASLPEDEPGELVDGRLEEEETPSYVHEVIVLWLGALFRAWVVPRGGSVGGSETKFALRPGRGRKPDLAVFFPGSPRPDPRASVQVLPSDVMVEIVTATPRDGRRDRVEKLEEYAAFGVRMYWILDPELRTLEVYDRDGSGRYVRIVSASEGDVAIPGCDGLVVGLTALWAEIDALLAT